LSIATYEIVRFFPLRYTSWNYWGYRTPAS